MFYFFDKFYYPSVGLAFILILLIFYYFQYAKKEDTWKFLKRADSGEDDLDVYEFHYSYYAWAMEASYDVYVDELDEGLIGSVLEEEPEELALAYLRMEEESSTDEDQRAIKRFVEKEFGIKYTNLLLERKGWVEGWY